MSQLGVTALLYSQLKTETESNLGRTAATFPDGFNIINNESRPSLKWRLSVAFIEDSCLPCSR